ncbi:MAG: PAS domain S-box protein [Verrucomicrobia bacterium]|nr:PAS domain S-box protein [Verrucomicrobiota bacterium]MBV8485121.1 PAS domain S-box protein [Verrucomicrobiota bacterium]
MSSQKPAKKRPVQSTRHKKTVASARTAKSAVGTGENRVGEKQRTKDLLTAIFRFAPDAVIIVDENGRITRVNDQVKALFGYTSRELVGKRMEVLIPPRFRDRHVEHRKDYMSGPRLREMGMNLELYALRKDGSEFPVDIMLSPADTDEGRVIIATVRDVTGHKQVEEALRKSHQQLEARVRERTAELTYATQTAVAAFENRARQQSAVAELSRRALEGRDLTSVLDDAVLLVTKVLDVEFCKILELAENALSLRAGVGWKEGSVGKISLPIGLGSHGGFTLLSSSPVVVEDLRAETRFKAPAFFLEHGIRSGVSVIIHGRGKPYGILGAHTKRQRSFTGDDVHFLQSVADALAAAIERRVLEEELLKASSREQQRIGQDLHDSLCQQLAGIEFQNSVLVQQLSKTSDAQAEAARIGELIRNATKQARALARGLSPVEIEPNGLMAALNNLAINATNLFRVRCSFECPQAVLLENRASATHLYRIAQEAIGNAVKHGQAKTVLIILKRVDGELILTVKDDGVGFSQDGRAIEGMGLRIMEYRADMIGAMLRIDSLKGEGTTVACRLRLG